jgi:hypothetical protein
MEKVTFTPDGVCVRVWLGSVADTADPKRRIREFCKLRWPGSPQPIFTPRGPSRVDYSEIPNWNLEYHR